MYVSAPLRRHCLCLATVWVCTITSAGTLRGNLRCPPSHVHVSQQTFGVQAAVQPHTHTVLSCAHAARTDSLTCRPEGLLAPKTTYVALRDNNLPAWLFHTSVVHVFISANSAHGSSALHDRHNAQGSLSCSLLLVGVAPPHNSPSPPIPASSLVHTSRIAFTSAKWRHNAMTPRLTQIPAHRQRPASHLPRRLRRHPRRQQRRRRPDADPPLSGRRGR